MFRGHFVFPDSNIYFQSHKYKQKKFPSLKHFCPNMQTNKFIMQSNSYLVVDITPPINI